ncbi:MAG: hypothetical protein D6731_23935 [Planctomycetota bacterium]|nr:MAG: hypothetical protein D6731_23935 [Planctomycetota bacterium]
MKQASIGVLLVACAGSVWAQADPREAELVRIAVDPGKRDMERVRALLEARQRVYQRDPPRDGPLKEALGPLLHELGKQADDLTHARLQAAALQALKPFAPWPDLASVVRPFLAKGVALKVRIEALIAVRDHGARGLAGDLLPLLDERLARRTKERFELTVIEAAKGLPDPEAARVVGKALGSSRSRKVKLAAARLLATKRGPEGRQALLAACDPRGRDEDVAGVAALSLIRYGTLEGVGRLVRRFEAREGNSQVLYRSICRCAFREDRGFAGVSPDAFFQVEEEQRRKAIAEVLAWWAKTEGTTPEELMFAQLRDKLREKGVAVPSSLSDKGTVDALIAALGVEPLSLRYAALDVLIRLTGRGDFFSDFRSILINLGANRVKMREWEPTYGFTDPRRQAELRKEQALKAERFRQWWDAVKDRAEWDGRRWRVRG